jgi:hypothetical protein
LRVAGAGPISMIVGSAPETAAATMRARRQAELLADPATRLAHPGSYDTTTGRSGSHGSGLAIFLLGRRARPLRCATWDAKTLAPSTARAFCKPLRESRRPRDRARVRSSPVARGAITVPRRGVRSHAAAPDSRPAHHKRLANTPARASHSPCQAAASGVFRRSIRARPERPRAGDGAAANAQRVCSILPTRRAPRPHRFDSLRIREPDRAVRHCVDARRTPSLAHDQRSPDRAVSERARTPWPVRSLRAGPRGPDSNEMGTS